MKVIKDQSVANLIEASILLKKESLTEEEKNRARLLIKSTILLLSKL